MGGILCDVENMTISYNLILAGLKLTNSLQVTMIAQFTAKTTNSEKELSTFRHLCLV